MIDDEQLGYQSWNSGIVNTWVDLITSDVSSAQATKYLSLGYHKIRVRLWEITGSAYIRLAMVNTTQGAVLVSSISDANIIPSSLFVPYLKEDYYKAFDKKDLLMISPISLIVVLVRTLHPVWRKILWQYGLLLCISTNTSVGTLQKLMFFLTLIFHHIIFQM